MKELLEKYERLKEDIACMQSVAVAYSAGVDSTFLLHAAREALGERVLALTAVLYSVPEREVKEAIEYCGKHRIRHKVVELNELTIPGFADNPKDRCYLCKKALFSHMKEMAEQMGARELVEGSNADDTRDYRPGMKAISELGIKSPLLEHSFTKDEIRRLSRHFGLPTWDKPSYACLSSRIPYGELITADKLKMIEEAEEFMMELGFSQVRVRMHRDIARIEVEIDQLSKIMEDDIRQKIYKRLKEIGFSYITVDLGGFRSGNLNQI
ncbi:MAG: ATP-dependent sacrificial sulfur transferase LarE [Eubacterium sp.]|nr:ATP-dependent sacrificial sulfur transferase LarE [Eubacterium sp.]